MEITAHPTSPTRAHRRRLYARAARDGFEALLRELAPRGRPVLLPAYVGWSPREGSGLFDPVRATGIDYAFYPLDERLRVEVEGLGPVLDERKPAAVVLVHYFGFPDPATPEVADLCADRDVILVEDCAHLLGGRLGSRAVGAIGDYSMASLHKVLTCRAGGFLQANGDRPLPPPLPPGAGIDPADLAILASADVEAAALRRRRNYLALLERVRGVPGVRPFHDSLPDGAVPLNLPLLVEEADRFEVYKAMRARSVGVVALYHTLVDALDREAFPAAFSLSERMLNLPIHQDVGDDELGRVAEALREALLEAAEGAAP